MIKYQTNMSGKFCLFVFFRCSLLTIPGMGLKETYPFRILVIMALPSFLFINKLFLGGIMGWFPFYLCGLNLLYTRLAVQHSENPAILPIVGGGGLFNKRSSSPLLRRIVNVWS